MALGIKAKGTELVRKGTPAGQMTEVVLSPGADITGAQELRLDMTVDGSANSGLWVVELENASGGNPVKRVELTEASFAAALTLISHSMIPVAAGSEGDNGSTDTEIRWKVDPVSFATGKLILSCQGNTEGSSAENSFLARFRTSTPLGFPFVARYYGKGGRVYYELPFEVLA